MKAYYDIEEGMYNIEPITTKATVDRYGMTNDMQSYVNLKNKKIVCGYVTQKGINGSEFHLSPKYATTPDGVLFQSRAGHELAHCIHNYKFGGQLDIVESETAAYDYSIGVFLRAGRVEEALMLTEQVAIMGYLRPINPLYKIPF